ncbi:hypothetical protein [Sphaerisporangium rhizosphaerae]|uniref:Uncharacterized protein n=1 Tax=Sphaerisporangium rhizosphaerae TaxID=2269375 RepID=A0ABW2NTY9_9ACTN
MDRRRRRRKVILLLLAGFLVFQGVYVWAATSLPWGWTRTIVAAAAAFISMSFSYVSLEFRRRERLKQAADAPDVRLKRRIESVNAAFTEAAKLMDDLRRDLAAQQAARDAILAQAAEQHQLLEVNREQAEKIRKILVGETKATIRAERRREWGFFLAGLLASAMISIPIGIWVNHIS